jgi:hypothetical protein
MTRGFGGKETSSSQQREDEFQGFRKTNAICWGQVDERDHADVSGKFVREPGATVNKGRKGSVRADRER